MTDGGLDMVPEMVMVSSTFEQSFRPVEEVAASDKSNCSDNFSSTLIERRPDDLAGAEFPRRSQHQCRFCGKRYARLDHMKRHYQSHEDGRAYICAVCSKGFNRKDLLDRHRAVHGYSSVASEHSSKRQTRAAKACHRCIVAKTKCSNERPCQRCRDRGEACGREPRLSTSIPPLPDQQPQSNVTTQFHVSYLKELDVPHHSGEADPMTIATSWNQEKFADENDHSVPRSMDRPSVAMQPSFDWLTSDGASLSFAWDPTFPSLDSVFDADNDTLMAIDLDWNSMIQPENNQTSRSLDTDSPELSKSGARRTGGTRSRVLLGQEAFKKSIWQWDPDPRDSASWEEAPQLSEADERLLLSAGSAEGILADRDLGVSQPRRLICGSHTRDALLLLVQQNTDPTVVVRSFPSPEVLSFLLNASISRERLSRCPCIHLPSFTLDKCRTELFSALIVAGTAEFSNRQIWKLGLALQERTRLAIHKALDDNNAIARNLDIVQASLLWVESGLWSGSRRKMEVAESAANNVPTMIRRAGAFHLGYYEHTSIPTLQDDNENLRSKWLNWSQLETFKRCVLRALIDDIQGSVAFMRSPSFSSTEITFVLPTSRDLWYAPDPMAWRTAYLAKQDDGNSPKPTLLDVVQDPSVLQHCSRNYDCELSIFAALHCLWPQVASFLDAKVLHRKHQKGGQYVLWLESQRQDLYRRLSDLRNTLESQGILTAEAQMICELFMMALFISFVDIQKLAGRFGINEARLAIPNLQSWSESDEPRYAMWHAGQVLKAAQSMEATQLCGFYAIAVYQACLTLALPFLLDAVALASTRGSPEPAARSASTLLQTSHTIDGSDKSNLVVLNGKETMQVKSYILTGQGSPALLLGREIKVLSNVDMIPTVIADIFGSIHSATVERLPPLLETLVILVRDLTRLTGR